jgi:hypothetical protein
VGGEAIGSGDDHRRSQAGPEGIGEGAAEGRQKQPEPQGRVAAAQHGRQTSRAVVLQLSQSQPASDGRGTSQASYREGGEKGTPVSSSVGRVREGHIGLYVGVEVSLYNYVQNFPETFL